MCKCDALGLLFGCSAGHGRVRSDRQSVLLHVGWLVRVTLPVRLLALTLVPFSPLLVANLWDVTDGDIDRFSQSVFDKLGLTAKQLKKGKGDADSRSVAAAVAGSRNACKLKYLTGASPVVYGIPIYL